MKPRVRSELVRRRLENGPSCIDECQVYVDLRREFDRIQDQWLRTRGVAVYAATGDDKIVQLCAIETWGRSWSSVYEEAKLAVFKLINNTSVHLRKPSVFPDLVTESWSQPWWEGGKPSWMHA